LTQTRPDVASPEIYRTLSPPPLQTQPYRSFPSARNIEESLPRRPLQTISFNEDAQEPSPRSPLLRLLRWDTDSAAVDDDKFVEGGYRSSGTPEPRKTLDAFAVLAQNAKRLQQREQKSLDRSKFVESEAVESDDDEMQGFGGFGAPADGENEETNGEDLDKALEGLVDDQEMNEDELGKEKILAKHQSVFCTKCVPNVH
jgi:mediator of replication checkpoint protein 1